MEALPPKSGARPTHAFELPAPAPHLDRPTPFRGAWRRATATSVRFLDDTTLLCASLLGRTMHVVSIASSEPVFLTSIATSRAVDLLDYRAFRAGLVVSADCAFDPEPGSISVYDHVRVGAAHVLEHRRRIDLPGLRPHGCAVIDERTVFILSASDARPDCVRVDLESGRVERLPQLNPKPVFPPKGVALRGDDLIVATTRALPRTRRVDVGEDSKLRLFHAPTLTLLDSQSFHGICDDVTFQDGVGVVALQSRNALLPFSVTPDRKLLIGVPIGGFFLPHGVALHGARLAVASYGDNSVRVYRMADLMQTRWAATT